MISNKPFVCGCCFPGIYAQKIEGGAVIADIEKRLATHRIAERVGQVYKVIFPDEMAEINQLCSKRPMENRNWYPGETLKDLERENSKHGIEV